MDARIQHAQARDRTIHIITRGGMTGHPRRTETWFNRIDGPVYLTGMPGQRTGMPTSWRTHGPADLIVSLLIDGAQRHDQRGTSSQGKNDAVVRGTLSIERQSRAQVGPHEQGARAAWSGLAIDTRSR